MVGVCVFVTKNWHVGHTCPFLFNRWIEKGGPKSNGKFRCFLGLSNISLDV
ncbi:hypothetical protein M3J09_005643 [Ascochyta lentis]